MSKKMNVFSTLGMSYVNQGFPGSTSGKESACQCKSTRDPGSVPGSGRPSGEGNGNPLQCSCLENLVGSKIWWATVQVVAESDMTGQKQPYYCLTPRGHATSYVNGNS